MIEIRRDPDVLGRTEVIEALAHRRRRRVLRLLLPGGGLHVEGVVGSLAAMERDDPTAAPTDAQRIRLDLRHRHLPKLEAAGLIARRDGRVTARREALDDPLLGDLLGVEDEDWDDVLRCITDARRRAVLATVVESDGPVDVPVVAFEVTRRLDGVDRTERDAVARELHHVHLPKLADAGLVALEDGGTAVRYLGHPDLEDVAAGRREFGRVRPGVTH